MEKVLSSQIDNRALEIFDYERGLFDFVFKNKTWKTKIYNGIPFYYGDGKSLKFFIEFLKSQTLNTLFLHGQHRFKSMAASGQGKYKILAFDVNTLLQSDYEADFGNDELFNAVNWFMYSENGNWGIYIDTDLSLFVVGFESNLEAAITKALSEEELISNTEDLKEKLSDHISDEKILNNCLNEFIKNYFFS